MIPKLSRGRDFAGLLRYLVEGRDHAFVDRHGVAFPETAAAEMALVAAQAPRARSVVWHISLSAAAEDGSLTDAQWRSVIDAVVAEFDLVDHQRIAVRHRDKPYDHIHLMICTVSPERFRTPPRQMFRARPPRGRDDGMRALSPEQVASLSPADMVRGSFDRFALYRLQSLCRATEERLGLRRLRSRRAGSVEQQAPVPRVSRGQEHRISRLGSRDLSTMAADLRAALDEPDWDRTQVALARRGVGLEPAIRKSRTTGDRVVGLSLYDLDDPGTRLKASALSVATRRYGLAQIEKRRAPDALSLERWWPQRPPVPKWGHDEKPEAQDLHAEYALYRQRRRAQRAQASLERARLKREYSRKRKALMGQAMARRRLAAEQIPRPERRAFYVRYAREVRAPVLERLQAELREHLAALRVPRMETFRQFRERQAPQVPVVAATPKMLAPANERDVHVSTREVERAQPRVSRDRVKEVPETLPQVENAVEEDMALEIMLMRERSKERGR